MRSHPKTPELRAFLDGYAELVKKYGIQIGSCGCCNSPWPEHATEWDRDAGARRPMTDAEVDAMIDDLYAAGVS
jgi:hypothetical protein